VTTLAGGGGPGSAATGDAQAGYADGRGSAALFLAPRGIAVDPAGNVYVGDYGNCRVRAITATGDVSTLSGSTF
jgi:DNA-binding beta-propeller fold protein YncE